MTWAEDLAVEITKKVISRHFLYADEDGKVGAGRNDRKCVKCKSSIMRRRFKTPPEELVDIIERGLQQRFVSELLQQPEAFVKESYFKGGSAYTELERLGEIAVHNWIKSETYVGESRTRTNKYVNNWGEFVNHFEK